MRVIMAADEWWSKKSQAEQEKYKQEHPGSKLNVDATIKANPNVQKHLGVQHSDRHNIKIDQENRKKGWEKPAGSSRSYYKKGDMQTSLVRTYTNPHDLEHDRFNRPFVQHEEKDGVHKVGFYGVMDKEGKPAHGVGKDRFLKSAIQKAYDAIHKGET